MVKLGLHAGFSFEGRRDPAKTTSILILLAVLILLLFALSGAGNSVASENSVLNVHAVAAVASNSSTDPPIWPMYQNNPQHTSLSVNNGPSNPQTEWIYGPIGPVTSSPVIGANGTVYFVSGNNRLYALRQDGSYLWSVKIGEASATPAIGSNDVIYVPTTKHIFAYAPTGNLLWNVSLSQSQSASPLTLSPTGTVYEVSNHILYGITATGQVSFSVSTQCDGSAAALGQSGAIYCTASTKNSNGSNLFAYNSSGQLLWSYAAGTTGISLTPTIGTDGTIYVITSGGLLDAVSSSGTLLWQNTIVHQAQTPPAIGPDGTLYAAGVDLLAFYPGSQSLKWQLTCFTPPGGTSCVQFGVITGLAVDASGNLYVEDATTSGSSLLAFTSSGSLIWDYSGFGTAERLQASPAISSNGAMYLGTACFTCSQGAFGKLYAIGLGVGQSQFIVSESGLPNSTLWSFFLNGENYTTSSKTLTLSAFSGSYSWNVLNVGYNSSLGSRYAVRIPNGTVNVAGPTSLYLNFSKQYQVSIVSDPPGVGSVTPSGPSWYFPPTTIQLNTSQSSQYPFYSWISSNMASIKITNASETNATALINGTGAIIAVYYSPITMTAGPGGSVSYVSQYKEGTLESQNSTITIYIPAGTIVYVTAHPESGYSFARWISSAVSGTNMTSPSLSFRSGYALNLTASFSPSSTSSSSATGSQFTTNSSQTTNTSAIVFPTSTSGASLPSFVYVGIVAFAILILIGASAAIAFRGEGRK